MRRTITWLLAALIGISLWQGRLVAAATTDFSVAAVPATNQVDQRHHYFDLLVAPGSTQTLMIKIQNTANTTQRYVVSPNRATTSSTGDTDYSTHSPQRSTSLPIDIESLLPKPKVYTVAPRKTRTIKLLLQAPKTAWQGILLGAIHVQKCNADHATSGGVAATASLAYNIGVQLRATKILPTQAPKLAFDGIKRKAVSDGTQVFAQLDNPTSALQAGLSVDAKVYRGAKLVQENHGQSLRIAPNSVMAYPTDPSGARLQPGDYRLDVTANQGTAKWHFTREFTIVKPVIKASKTTAKPASRKTRLALPAWLVALLVGSMVGLAAVVWRLSHKRK